MSLFKGGMLMKKYKKELVLKRITKDLNFYEVIILQMLKNYTIKIYTIGRIDEYNANNKKR